MSFELVSSLFHTRASAEWQPLSIPRTREGQEECVIHSHDITAKPRHLRVYDNILLKKKMTRPLDGLLGTIVWSSHFPLGSHHRCFHSSEVSPTLPFCKNLSLFYIEPGVSSAKLHRTVLLHFPRDLCFPVLAPNGVIVCVLIKTLRCITWPTWTMESKPVSLFREYVREFIFSLCHLFLPFKTRLILIPENFMVHCSPS